MGELHRSRAGALFNPRLRDVPNRTRLALYARAGGRREFDGCNRCGSRGECARMRWKGRCLLGAGK